MAQTAVQEASRYMLSEALRKATFLKKNMHKLRWPEQHVEGRLGRHLDTRFAPASASKDALIDILGYSPGDHPLPEISKNMVIHFNDIPRAVPF